MEEDSVIIELDTVLEYRDGQVYIKKMVTSEMPVTLTFAIIEALNKNDCLSITESDNYEEG